MEVGGTSFVPDAVGFGLYPLIQPLARVLIGVWLWQHRDEGEAPAPNRLS